MHLAESYRVTMTKQVRGTPQTTALDHSQPTDCSPGALSAHIFPVGLWMLAFEDGTECQVDKTDLKKVSARELIDGFSIDCLFPLFTAYSLPI